MRPLASSTICFRTAGCLAARCLIIAGLFLPGCSALSPTLPQLADCQRSALEPSPLWTAAATWNHAADQLLLVDPGSASLLVYGLDGELERRVETDLLSQLEYSTPMRLEASKSGYLLGDTSNLLWFDDAFHLVEHQRPFDGLGEQGIRRELMSDFVETGEALFAYADFEGEDEAWQRGFVRLGLNRPGFRLLHSMTAERGGEFTSYFHYDHRPYIVHLGNHAYFLRLTEPATISRATRKGLTPLHTLSPEPGLTAHDVTATALYAWNKKLYLLLRIDHEAPTPSAETVKPELLSGAHREMLELMEMKGEDTHHWELHAIDPRSGRRLARYRLPATADRLRLIPGSRVWGLLEEGVAPNTTDSEHKTILTLLPARWFSAPGDGRSVELVCL